MDYYKNRMEKMWDWMAQEGIAMVMFEDFEGKRDTSLRWLTGHPGDALLFLSADRKSLLLPWDMILAKIHAKADTIVPYNDFGRSSVKAIRAAAEMLKIPAGSKIEIPHVTPYPVFLDFVGELSGFDVLCREKSASEHALSLRMIKDDDEISILREAAGITSKIVDILEKKVRSGKIKSEADAALLIELEARKRGCEGTGFETLAAGPGRSFGIHAFPAWSSAPFAAKGLSILDFGVRLHGYNTDVTMTFVRDPNPEQRKMVELVEEAAELAKSAIAPGNNTHAPVALVEELFAKSGRTLDHGLGHGIGLDVHELPFFRSRAKNAWELQPGMVFAIEPGLYDPVHGGCRFENDFLITEKGYEVLTKSRVVRL
jgi:Xaa-Pro dipeptidase